MIYVMSNGNKTIGFTSLSIDDHITIIALPLSFTIQCIYHFNSYIKSNMSNIHDFSIFPNFTITPKNTKN